MESTVNHNPAIVCAENISFLFLLHSVPTLPSRNALETATRCAQGYVLSLEEECRLAESLAFLANDSDDVNHIPALCIEQDPTTSSTNVLLAVNCARWQAGVQSLRRLRIGFESIFLSLANSGQQMENDVFSAIVSMCAKRILLRLRLSRSKRGLPKRNIQQILHSAIESLSRLGMKSSDHHYKPLCSFIKEARLVIRLADNWVNHQTIVQLRELVDSVYHLRRVVDTEALLGGLTARDMDPCSRKSLTNIINKIARYREIARCLYRMSKKKTSLRQMRLTTIDLPVEAYVRPPKVSATPTLGHVLARAQQSFRNTDITRIHRLINTTNPSVNSQFASQVMKTLTESKIHAEIQVLYYLESNPSSLPPRIVASSKDACFLCNAFIHMHGKMHTARTHGRLYPGWRLPFTPTFVSLEQKFNVVLESMIDASLRTLLSRGQKTVYPDPNESTLLMLPVSASTLRSLPAVQDDATVQKNITPHPSKIKMEPDSNTITIKSEEQLEEEFDEEFEDQSRQSEDPSEEDPEDQLESRSMTLDTKEEAGAKIEKLVDAINVKNMSNKTSTASSKATSDASSEVEMIQGHSIVLERGEKLVRAGKLHLHIEYPDQIAIMQRTQNVEKVMHSLAWLDDMEAGKLAASEETAVTNVEYLDNGITCEVNDQGCLFIAARGVVVRITVMTEAS